MLTLDAVAELMNRSKMDNDRDDVSMTAMPPTAIPPHSTYVHEKTKIQTGDRSVPISDSIATPTVPITHAVDVPLPPSSASSVSGAVPVRINPRTGKPVSLPKPLSLSPRKMSPIQTETDHQPGGQMIREEHVEVRLSFQARTMLRCAIDHTTTRRWTPDTQADYYSNLSHARRIYCPY
jgi:hypothetical protein